MTPLLCYKHKSMLYGIHWIHRLHRLPDYQTPRLSKNPYRVQPLNPNPLKSCFRTAHKYPRKKIINIECPLHPHTNWVHLHNHPYSNAQLESKTNQIAQRYIFQKNSRTKSAYATRVQFLCPGYHDWFQIFLPSHVCQQNGMLYCQRGFRSEKGKYRVSRLANCWRRESARFFGFSALRVALF